MADEPTAGEVSRALEAFRQQIHDELGSVRDDARTFRSETNARLDRTVQRDVYLADRRTDKVRNDQLRAEMDELQKARENRAANRKWVIAAVLIPIGVAILEVYFTIRGVR